jgi:hypothetical protein
VLVSFRTAASNIVLLATINVFTLDIADLFQSLAKNAQSRAVNIGRGAAEEPDYWHRWLLRACRERPGCNGTTKHYDEVSPPHGAFPWAEKNNLPRR